MYIYIYNIGLLKSGKSSLVMVVVLRCFFKQQLVSKQFSFMTMAKQANINNSSRISSAMQLFCYWIPNQTVSINCKTV